MHWAQQLLALIKKGETQQLSARDSQFCCPQPGLPEARLTPPPVSQPGQGGWVPAWSLGSCSGTGIRQKTYVCNFHTNCVCAHSAPVQQAP